MDVSILKDGVDEVDELFHLILTLQYAPFDIPLDEYTVTIVDSGELAVCMYVCSESVHLASFQPPREWNEVKH